MIRKSAPNISLESILIVSEDQKSSVYYFQDKVKDLQLSNCQAITIKIMGSHLGTSPDKVAESAIKICNTFNAEAKKKGLLPYTKVYCLIDTDDWGKKLIEAKNTLKNATNSTTHFCDIVSNECFEAWYILHFKALGDTKPIRRPRKGIDTKMLVSEDERTDKLLEKYLGQAYKKGENIYELLKNTGNEAQAIQNAEWLAKYHTENPTEGNPATDVFIVVKHLNQMAETFLGQTKINITGNIILSELTDNYSFTDAFKMQLIALINETYKDESKEDKIILCNNILAKPMEVSSFTEDAQIMAFIYENQECYE